jgi:hypothetical protein
MGNVEWSDRGHDGGTTPCFARRSDCILCESRRVRTCDTAAAIWGAMGGRVVLCSCVGACACDLTRAACDLTRAACDLTRAACDLTLAA